MGLVDFKFLKEDFYAHIYVSNQISKYCEI